MYTQAKLLRRCDLIAQWQNAGVTPHPIGFDINITDACPHTCPGCNARHDTKAVMPMDEAIDTLRMMAAWGVRGVNFCGGEPLAHPNIAEILSAAKGYGLTVGLITNLYRLDDKLVQSITENCLWVRVSVDAGDKDSYQRRHGSDDFAGLIERLAKLASSNRPGCMVGAAMLTDEDAGPDIAGFLHIADSCGVDYAAIRPYNGDTWDARRTIAEARAGRRLKVHVADSKYGGFGRNYATCHAPWFWVVVRANGSVRTCCEARGENTELCKVDELLEYWGSDEMKAKLAALDVSKCPAGCRMDANNRLLNSIAAPIFHENHI